jgi:hypothetical protein
VALPSFHSHRFLLRFPCQPQSHMKLTLAGWSNSAVTLADKGCTITTVASCLPGAVHARCTCVAVIAWSLRSHFSVHDPDAAMPQRHSPARIGLIAKAKGTVSITAAGDLRCVFHIVRSLPDGPTITLWYPGMRFPQHSANETFSQRITPLRCSQRQPGAMQNEINAYISSPFSPLSK